MNTDAELDYAYQQGRAAHADDRGVDDAPYSGRLREAWEEGWTDSHGEQAGVSH